MNYKKILIAVIIISIFAVGVLDGERYRIEKENNSVEFMLDYNTVNDLADQSDKNISVWLDDFKSWGATGVAVEEESIRTLIDSGEAIDYVLAQNVTKEMNWEEKYSKEVITYINSKNVDKYDLVVTTKSPKAIKFLKEGTKENLDDELYKTFDNKNGSYTWIFDGNINDVSYIGSVVIMDDDNNVIKSAYDPVSSSYEYLGLGFDEEKIKNIKESNLDLNLRPRNFGKSPEKSVQSYINDVKKYKPESKVLIATAKEVIGAADDASRLKLDDTVEFLKKEEIHLGLIETNVQRSHIEQAGINYSLDKMEYDAVRVFPMVSYLQKRFKYYNYDGSEEIENTIYRAVTERNIRLVYFKPFLNDTEKTYVLETTEYKRMFVSLEKRLSEHGYEFGNASALRLNEPSIYMKAVAGIGVGALILLVASYVINLAPVIWVGLLGLGSVGTLGALYIAPNLASSILGLAASITFPSAGIIFYVLYLKHALNKNEKNLTKIIISAAKGLLIPAALSFVGALYVGGILSDSPYLLEKFVFRGVKIAQLLPMVVFAIAYLLIFGYGRGKDELKLQKLYLSDIMKVLEEKIAIKYAVAGVVAAAIGYIYIARTGHESGIEPSNLEMIFRNFLEYSFIARPRTKEFLLAFPAVMLSVQLASYGYKKLLFPVGAVAIIGFTSIANTFSHLRTPLYLSIYRTVYSLGFGLVIGVIGILIFSMVPWIIIKCKGRISNE